MKSDYLIERLRALSALRNGAPLHASSSIEAVWLSDAADEIERLRRILDSRPAINVGLPETYVEWTHGVYQSDFAAYSGRKPS